MLNEKAATATFFTNVDTATASKEFMTARNSKNLIRRNTLICQVLQTNTPSRVKPSFDKELIREALPFARLMEHYGFEVLANEQVRCMFHGEDRRPSATIRNEFFYCYTCGEKHDVFSFIMAMERCDFSEALRKAANIAGIAYPEQSGASRHKLALAVQARKHDTAERRRVSMSSEQKYLLLSTVARTVRQDAPEWLAKLDSLLADWLHDVPDDVDLRTLLSLVQGKHFDAMGPVISRLYAEQEWVNHA